MDEFVPSSFSKSLFFGRIPEKMVIPYPRLGQDERMVVERLVSQIAAFAERQIDSSAIDRLEKIPPAVLAGIKQLGLFGLAIDRQYGGLGLSSTGYARVMEEVAQVDAAVAVTLRAHQSIGCRGIVLYGSADQKQRYLPRLASGAWVAAFALTEAESGSDAASVQTKAEPHPSGFVLSGRKTWVTNGALANLFTVFAQTRVERGGEQKNRISAFLVERDFGAVSGSEERKLGVRGASTTSLELDGVTVPRENVLGEVGGGFKVAMGILNNGRVEMAASAVGSAKAALKLALKHVTSRQQFGRNISEFGLIKDKIARMMVDLFAAESMVYLTCGLIDQGVVDYSIESACCKVYGSEMLTRVTGDLLQIVAGLGYMSAYPYERMMRDARVNLVFEGTNEILRCFIALSGMQGPGERLAQLAEFIKWPLKGYGLAVDFVIDKLKVQYYGGERLDQAHALIKREAVYFEDFVDELSKAVEKALRKHGREISEMQYVQRRVADITIDLYLLIACISRATASILQKGAPASEQETKLCRVACGRAAQRIRKNLRLFDDNDDELLKAIAKDATHAMKYPFELLLNWPV